MKPVLSVRRYTSPAIADVTVSDVRYACQHRQARHDHSYSSITLVVDGSLDEQGPLGDHSARTGSVVFKPAGVRHSNTYGPRGARTLQVVWQASNATGEHPWNRAFRDYRWIDGGPPAFALLRLFRVFVGEEFSPELALEEGLCELTGIIAEPGQGRGGARCAPWLGRVVDRLSDSLTKPPRVSELAAEVAVHPVYLARAFRRRHGCSISRFVRRQRVAEVCRRIVSSNDSLAEIALDTGFADQPHLCRVFRAEMGMTPARFRKLVREQ